MIVSLTGTLSICWWLVLRHLQVVVVLLVIVVVRKGLLIVVVPLVPRILLLWLDRRRRFPMLWVSFGCWQLVGFSFALEVHLGGNADTGAKCPGPLSVEVHSIAGYVRLSFKFPVEVYELEAFFSDRVFRLLLM